MAERHPDLSFVHIYPGVVNTPALRTTWYFSLVATLTKPFLRTPEDAASFMLYPMLHPDYSQGGFWLSKNADKLALGDNTNDEVTRKVWDHIVSRAQLQ